MTMNETARKTVLITGASSGFGKLSAKLFAKNNWNVVATMRTPDKETELNEIDNILVTRLDVTDEASINEAVNIAIEKFGRIDALVNNAGYGATGLFEDASREEIQYQLDVNVMGVIAVTQAVLPHMRAQKSGRIINLSSIAGQVGFPGFSIYNTSKFALEGLSEALRMEVKDLGIDVQIIEPGGFRTNFVEAVTINQGRTAPNLEKFRTKMHSFFQEMIKEPPKPFGYGDAQVVADLIYDCATGRNRKFRIPVGKDAKMLLFMRKILCGDMFFNTMRKQMMPK